MLTTLLKQQKSLYDFHACRAYSDVILTAIKGKGDFSDITDTGKERDES